MTNELTIRTIDNEPRILDIELAEKLGMKNPRFIRANLIKPNADELRSYGNLIETNSNAGKPGRPALVYYLNEEQALLLCMFSRTEAAKAVRAEVIKVFTAYRRGDLQPVAPALPDFTNPVTAARAWADAMEGKLIADQTIEEHLRFVTVDEWRALSHIYLTHNDKVRLGQRAAKLSREAGVEIGKQVRVVQSNQGPLSRNINVYRMDFVNAAATILGIAFTPFMS